MAKEKEKERVELRPVDESVDKDSRFYRLHKDRVEELDDVPAPRVGGKLVPEARLEAIGKDGLKIRSVEPGVASLIERDADVQEKLEAGWEGSSQERGLPWGWLALIGCAFAGGILWSLVEVNRAGQRQEELVNEAKGILEKELGEDMEAEKTLSTIESTVEQFFDSRSVAELLGYVRHPERVRPLMEEYYSENAPVPLRVESVQSMDPLTIGNLATFWMVRCRLSDGSDVQLLVETISENEVKIDWETFVCYQAMDWGRFARERPEGFIGNFRVYVEMDTYYNYEFSDSERFMALRLSALDSEEVLYGYVERGSMLASKIVKLSEENQGAPVAMILQLEVPRNARAKRGVIVKKLLCERWLYLKSPEVGQ